VLLEFSVDDGAVDEVVAGVVVVLIDPIFGGSTVTCGDVVAPWADADPAPVTAGVAGETTDGFAGAPAGVDVCAGAPAVPPNGLETAAYAVPGAVIAAVTRRTAADDAVNVRIGLISAGEHSA